MIYDYDAERVWDPSEDVHVELVDDILYVYMTDPGSDRTVRRMTLPSSDDAVSKLDAGEDPLGWEDGNGHTIRYENGIPVNTLGQPHEWISVSVRGGEEHVAYFTFESDAVEHAQQSWTHLTASERKTAREYVASIDETYPYTGDLLDITWDTDNATMWFYFDHWDHVFRVEVPWDDDPWHALETYDDIHGTSFFDNVEEENYRGIDLMDTVRRAISVRTWDDVLAEDDVSEVACVKTIAANGNGLMLSITKEARTLGLDRGDTVDVIIRKRK